MGRGKNIAYIRVSTVEQNEARQKEALQPYNIDKWFIEKASGKDTKCQTAHCGRRKLHFDFGETASPIVPCRYLPQTLSGMTAGCRSLV